MCIFSNITVRAKLVLDVMSGEFRGHMRMNDYGAFANTNDVRMILTLYMN